MDPVILLVVGALGLVGCLILLFLGINMLREERAAKDVPPAAAAEPGAAPEPARFPFSAPPVATVEPAASSMAAPAASREPEPLYGPPPLPASSALTLGTRFAGVLAGLTARLPARAAGAARGSAHEVLRVLRDNLTGRILIELSGQRYHNLADLRDPVLRQALQTILEDLDSLRGGLAAEPPGRPMAIEPDLAASASPPLDGADALAAPAAPASPPASPPARPPATPARTAPAEARPLPRPTMNPFKQIAVLREISKNPPPPALTIAEQIDVVLQANIQGTPLLERGLHMRPGPRGDAVFDLDGQRYSAVDELPDEGVRALVRAAIAEWEARQ